LPTVIVAPGATADAIALLPVTALRLDAVAADGLRRLGFI